MKKNQQKSEPIEPNQTPDVTATLKDQLLRSQAELENFRKRMLDERQTTIKFANADLIMQLLPVLDNFKRAAAHAPQTQDSAVTGWITGIRAVERQLEDILKSMGLIEIETVPGHPFDAKIHEAIAHEPSQQPEDTVTKVVETGYLLHDKVLRPAKVNVSSGPDAQIN
jgi:molecular chaperone GrpE